MPELPQTIDCWVTDRQRPVAGVMLRAEFTTLRKNSYVIVFGPTDTGGHAVLDRPTTLRQAASQMALALMDFDPLEEVFAGDVDVTIMRDSDVEGALRAHDLFGAVAQFSSHYAEDLKASLVSLRRVAGRALNIRVTANPPGVHLRTTGPAGPAGSGPKQ